MNRIKTFIKYLVLFLLFFAFVELMIYIGTRIEYKNFDNFNIKTEMPVIEIIKSEKINTKGNINLRLKNNTGKLVSGGTLILNFYDIDKTLVGNKYEKIKFFNVNEELHINIEYAFENVDLIEIDFKY